MAIVTDGLDQATLARYRARLAVIHWQLEAVCRAAEGDEPGPGWVALANALNGLDNALGYLDQAQDELPHEGDGDE